MQKSNVDFYPVLLLSILADTLLRLHTGYWARAGLLALPASAAVLAAVLLLVSTSWQGNALLQKVLCVLLAISSALEILRLHALFGSVYPGTLGLAGTCFVVLAPVIYLRREPALRQTANALLVFGAACMAIMVLSVAPRLRVPNLHAAPLPGQDWQAAFVSQLALPPEYLLFALWPPQPGQRCRKAVTFAASALGFDAAVHLLLELFFGAAMPTRQTPVQGAAQCGALSIFNRLEWLQILLWCMAVTVRLALYLYAMVELWGGRAGAGSAAAGLDRYPHWALMPQSTCCWSCFLARPCPPAKPRCRGLHSVGRFQFLTGWNGCKFCCGAWQSRCGWHCTCMPWWNCGVAAPGQAALPPGWTVTRCTLAAWLCCVLCCAPCRWNRHFIGAVPSAGASLRL